MCGSQNGDDEHICAHQSGATEKRTSTTNSFDKEEQEEQARNDLDNAKEACDQEVVLACANSREHLRSIYVV